MGQARPLFLMFESSINKSHPFAGFVLVLEEKFPK
jgi:hypothetical protein